MMFSIFSILSPILAFGSGVYLALLFIKASHQDFAEMATTKYEINKSQVKDYCTQ